MGGMQARQISADMILNLDNVVELDLQGLINPGGVFIALIINNLKNQNRHKINDFYFNTSKVYKTLEVSHRR